MIAVATLLVAVVGATFAYFTATTTTTGKNVQTTVTTKKVGSTSFNLTGSEIEKKMDYPGGIEIIEGVVEAKRTGEEDSNSYNFAYGLSVTATNNLTTTLNWSLFEEDKKLQLDSGTTACKLVTEAGKGDGSNETHYYYTHDGSTTTDDGEDCKAENLLKTKLTTFGSPLAKGTIANGSGVTITDGEEELASRTISTNDGNAKSKYYYLVVEYPNSGNQTTTDAGNTVQINLDLAGNVVATIAE